MKGWALSPVPPSVYLLLPAGLLCNSREREKIYKNKKICKKSTYIYLHCKRRKGAASNTFILSTTFN